MSKVRHLAQRDWDQLVAVAAGYLTLTGGDLTAAMGRAIAAHAALVENVRRDRVRAQLPRGVVRLFVTEEGGLALEYEAGAKLDELPPDVTLDVVDPERQPLG